MPTKKPSNGGESDKGLGSSIWASVISGLVLIVFVYGIYNRLDDKIDKDREKIESVNTRLTKVEEAIKALASQQTKQTEDLVNRLLATAISSRKTEHAARALETAASLTATLREEKHPADPDFFQTAVKNILKLRQGRDLDVKNAAFKTELQLAEYRSSLVNREIIARYGFLMNCPPGDGGLFDFATPPSALAGIAIRGLALKNCSQLLDGLYWKDMLFVDSHIKYSGGPVILENVIFLNCTFEVGTGNESFQVLEYAALDKRDLRYRVNEVRSIGASGL